MPFVRETSGNPLTNKSSQLTIDLLTAITAADIAQSVPFLRIQRVDPTTRRPDPGVPPLNATFSRPPIPGRVLVGRERFAERPAASIESFSISTEQNYGHIIQQLVEIKVVAHRPGAVFDNDEDSVWTSLITPGESHLAEYGWVGSSKNDLINGQGFHDDDVGLVVPSRKLILFTTNYYTFTVKNDGQIEFTIKGVQNGNLVLRQVQLGDVLSANTDIDSVKPNTDATSPNQLDNVNNAPLRKELQNRLGKLTKNAITSKKAQAETVSFIEVLDTLLADTITRRATKGWSYDDVKMIIGRFNPRCPQATERFSKPNDEIADFRIPVKDIMTVITNSTRKGTNLTLENFIEQFLNMTVNSPASWKPGPIGGSKTIFAEIPQVIVKVTDESTKTKNVLRIGIFDLKRDVVVFFPEQDRLFDFGRDKVKKVLRDKKVPFISLGLANSYIKDASFEVIMDPQIQRAKIDAAAQFLKNRADVTHRSLRDLLKDSPQEFHQIYSSAIQGNISMLGNFALDTFSFIWMDFGISIWDGPFNVRQRTDSLSAAGFETTIEVYSEGADPLNTKARATKDQVNAIAELGEAQRELAQAGTLKGSKRKAAEEAANRRRLAAEEALRQAGRLPSSR